MKTRFSVYMAVLVVGSVAGPALFAQSPGNIPPGYGGYPASQSPFTPGQLPGVMPAAGPMVDPASFAFAGAPVVPAVGLSDVGCDAPCDGNCGGKCDSCCGCCVTGGYDKCVAFWGEFIYLNGRDSEVAYAVPFDGPIVPGLNTIQVGPLGVVDMDFQPGFRGGFDYVIDECTKIGGSYTFFESGTSNRVITQAPNVVRSLVSHPGVLSAAQPFLQADAQYDISYDLIDADFRQLISYGDNFQLGYLVGLRLAQHEQELQVDFAGAGTETISTDIDFYGAGLRGGLEYERYLGCQWTGYVKGFASFVPGEFRADFDQSQSFDARVVDTGWRAGRIVTIWELELGLGWTSKCGYYHLSAGYIFNAWDNTVQTDEWIRAVQQNSFIDMDDTMTFDGVVGRFELRY